MRLALFMSVGTTCVPSGHGANGLGSCPLKPDLTKATSSCFDGTKKLLAKRYHSLPRQMRTGASGGSFSRSSRSTFPERCSYKASGAW